MTIASMGLGIMQSMAQYSAAEQQYQAQMEVQRQNAINASLAAENQYANINIRTMQDDAAINQQKQQTNIEAAKLISTTEVAAAAGGVSGLSVEHVLRDIYAQKGRNDAVLDSNQQMQRDYMAGELKAAEAGGQSQINSVPIPEKPSFLPYALGAFSSGLNAYSNHRQRTA